MASSSYKFFFLALLLPLASCDSVIYESCSQNFTNNNVLQDNIGKALLGLAAQASSKGSAISTVGEGTKAVFGLAQCRGDIFDNPTGCSDCIVTAAKELQRYCTGSATAQIWYDLCSIRYNTTSFFGSVDLSLTRMLESTKKAEDPEAFSGAVSKLLEWVKLSAASGNSRFAVGRKNFATGNQTIYGMAQCTADLSGLACIQCLTQMSNKLKASCEFQQGCVAISGSCRLRYETYNFILSRDVPLFPEDLHASPAAAPSLS